MELAPFAAVRGSATVERFPRVLTVRADTDRGQGGLALVFSHVGMGLDAAARPRTPPFHEALQLLSVQEVGACCTPCSSASADAALGLTVALLFV